MRRGDGITFYISGFFDEISSSLQVQLEAMQAMGIRYMSPRNLNGKRISAYTAAEFDREIRPALDKAGVTFSSLGSPIGKIALRDKEGYQAQQKQLQELIRIAQQMECRYIRIFSFFVPKGDPAPLHEQVVEQLGGFLRIAEGSGVTLIHENEKKIYGDTPERALALHASLAHPQFQLCYDPSNYVQCGADAWKAYQATKDRTVYYHMKDCVRGIEVPLGTGEGDIANILADLQQRGYDGFLTLEPHTMLYAMLKQAVRCIPFLTFTNRGRVYRQIDRTMGIGALEHVSREQAFRWQYDKLIQILQEAGGQYE